MKHLLLEALKIVVCSGVLGAAYEVLLDRRAPLPWCRRYLLLLPLLAGIVPQLRIPLLPAPVIGLEPFEALPPVVAPTPAPEPPAASPESATLVLLLWAAGTLVLVGAMLRQLWMLRGLRREATICRAGRFRIVRTRRRIAPFSFWKTIYLWTETPAEEERAVLAHETSHLVRRHSAERILMEGMKALLWWNPFVWLAARRLAEAQEYEADRDVLAQGYDPAKYMDTLFRQLFGYSPDMASGLRNSFTKKRFRMMTTPFSGRYALLRLAGTIPVAIGLLCAFSLTTRAAEVRTATPPATAPNEERPFVGETIPRFLGGDPSSFRAWVMQRIRYPQEAMNRGIEGRVVLSIMIESDGAISSADVMMSPDELLTAEVLRVAGTVPAGAWSPGRNEFGEAIRTRYMIPVDFQLVPAETTADKAEKAERNEPFLVTKTMPQFQGGDLNTFRTWVQEQLSYPEEAKRAGVQRRVVATFVIERDGAMSSFEVLASPDKLLTDEALRVAGTVPAGAWSPGRDESGEAVRVKYTIPIDFRIDPTTADKE